MLDGCTIYKLLLILTQRDVVYKKKRLFAFLRRLVVVTLSSQCRWFCFHFYLHSRRCEGPVAAASVAKLTSKIFAHFTQRTPLNLPASHNILRWIYPLHTIYSSKFTRFTQYTPLNLPASRNILRWIYSLHTIYSAEFTRFRKYTPPNLHASRNTLCRICPLHTIYSAEVTCFAQYTPLNLPASHNILR